MYSALLATGEAHSSLITVLPGAYTAIESPAPQDSGIGLIEIYDQSPAPGASH